MFSSLGSGIKPRSSSVCTVFFSISRLITPNPVKAGETCCCAACVVVPRVSSAANAPAANAPFTMWLDCCC
jgi:hypothetical protein